MPDPKPQDRRHFTEAARIAAKAAKAAKQDGPDTFGVPELFIVRDDGKRFTWELRRFGGVLLQRGDESFSNAQDAKAAGQDALAVLCKTPELPTFKRALRP